MPSTTTRKLLLDKVPGMFGPIFVEARGDRRSMRFGSRDAVEQSLVDLAHPERPVPAYLRAAAWVSSLGDPPKRALLVGLGGGGFVRFLRKRFPRIEIDIVEIDPAVIHLAKSRFGIRESRRTRIHNTDAILHLATDPSRHNLILLDAYDGPTLSSRFFSTDFFALAAASLAEGGYCAANPSLRTRQEEATAARRFQRAFPAGSLRVEMPADRNRLLVGRRGPIPEPASLRSMAGTIDRSKALAFPVRPFACRAYPLGSRKRRRA